MRQRELRSALAILGLLAGWSAGPRCARVELCPSLAPGVGGSPAYNSDPRFGSEPPSSFFNPSVPETGPFFNDELPPPSMTGPSPLLPELSLPSGDAPAEPGAWNEQWKMTPQSWTLPDPLSDPVPPDADPGNAAGDTPFLRPPPRPAPETMPAPDSSLPGLPAPDPRPLLS